jgi:hypothetical protein
MDDGVDEVSWLPAPWLLPSQVNRLRIVVTHVGYVNGGRLYGAYLEPMIDDLPRGCHKYIVTVDKKRHH